MRTFPQKSSEGVVMRHIILRGAAVACAFYASAAVAGGWAQTPYGAPAYGYPGQYGAPATAYYHHAQYGAPVGAYGYHAQYGAPTGAYGYPAQYAYPPYP